MRQSYRIHSSEAPASLVAAFGVGATLALREPDPDDALARLIHLFPGPAAPLVADILLSRFGLDDVDSPFAAPLRAAVAQAVAGRTSLQLLDLLHADVPIRQALERVLYAHHIAVGAPPIEEELAELVAWAVPEPTAGLVPSRLTPSAAAVLAEHTKWRLLLSLDQLGEERTVRLALNERPLSWYLAGSPTVESVEQVLSLLPPTTRLQWSADADRVLALAWDQPDSALLERVLAHVYRSNTLVVLLDGIADGSSRQYVPARHVRAMALHCLPPTPAQVAIWMSRSGPSDEVVNEMLLHVPGLAARVLSRGAEPECDRVYALIGAAHCDPALTTSFVTSQAYSSLAVVLDVVRRLDPSSR